MTSVVIIFYLLAGLTGILYILFIVMYTIGWYRLRPCPVKTVSKLPFLSVIVPVRNEEQVIEYLLQDLEDQSYPGEKFEVIIVDDHSHDRTAEIVAAFQTRHIKLNLRLIRLSDEPHRAAFKKSAIATAIEAAKGTLIVTTDADCRIGSRWLAIIASCFTSSSYRMLVGPVSYHNERTLFERMQTQEFLSLIGITGGAISVHKPIMCNGANLAYEKEAYVKAGGFEKDRFSSGDDIFLMLKIRKLFGNRSIGFIRNTEALALTEAKKSPAAFLQQRTRWASKNKGYRWNVLIVSVTVYLFNLIIAAGLTGSIFVRELAIPSLIALVVKTLVEIPILIGITTFVKRTSMLRYVLPLAIIYPFYVVLVGAAGIMGRYTWKGRKIKN